MWLRCRRSISTRPPCGTRHAFMRLRRSARLTSGHLPRVRRFSTRCRRLRFALSLSAKPLTVTGRGSAPMRPRNRCCAPDGASRPAPNPAFAAPMMAPQQEILDLPHPSACGSQAGKRSRACGPLRPGGRVGAPPSLRRYGGARSVSAPPAPSAQTVISTQMQTFPGGFRHQPDHRAIGRFAIDPARSPHSSLPYSSAAL